MSNALKLSWYLWWFLSIMTALGATSLAVFNTPAQCISLNPGETIHVTIYRLFSDRLRMDFGVPNTFREHFRDRDRHIATESLNREMALFRAQVGEQSARYAISRIHGRGEKYFFFSMRPEHNATIVLDAFINELTLSVEFVDEVIQGAACEVRVLSPVPFKFTPYGYYKHFWWFHFWPIYGVILFVFLLILVWCSGRQKKRAKARLILS